MFYQYMVVHVFFLKKILVAIGAKTITIAAVIATFLFSNRTHEKMLLSTTDLTSFFLFIFLERIHALPYTDKKSRMS